MEVPIVLYVICISRSSYMSAFGAYELLILVTKLLSFVFVSSGN